jgi:hypothetical protein
VLNQQQVEQVAQAEQVAQVEQLLQQCLLA